MADPCCHAVSVGDGVPAGALGVAVPGEPVGLEVSVGKLAGVIVAVCSAGVDAGNAASVAVAACISAVRVLGSMQSSSPSGRSLSARW